MIYSGSNGIILKNFMVIVIIVAYFFFTKYVISYSIRDETIKSLKLYEELNDKILNLLLKQIRFKKPIPKSSIIVSCNPVEKHIKTNNQLLED